MSIKCSIELDNPLPYFYSGQLVRGCVKLILTTDEPDKFTDLTFQVKGETTCKWTEKEGIGKKDEKIVEYVGQEEYFKTVQSLFTAEYPRQDDCVMLNAGHYTFPFSFSLLSQLPSSFDGPYGSVKYSLQVIAKRPYKINDAFNRNITVVHHSDLNLVPTLSTPVSVDTNKNLYFLFSNQGTLSISISIPQSGFIPGQDIQITCTAENKSKVTVLEIVTSLQKITTYNVTSPKPKNRVEYDKLLRNSRKGPEKGETSSLNYSVTIPQTLPSTMPNCLINIKYLLKVKAVMSGIHTDLKLEIPITMGTVPIGATPPIGPTPPTGPTLNEKAGGLPPSVPIAPPRVPIAPPRAPIAPPRVPIVPPVSLPSVPSNVDNSNIPPGFPEPPPSYEESMRTPNPGPANSLYPTLNFN